MTWTMLAVAAYATAAFGLAITLATNDETKPHDADGWIAVAVVAALWPGLLASGAWDRWIFGRKVR